jgi:hypothetical protein
MVLFTGKLLRVVSKVLWLNLTNFSFVCIHYSFNTGRFSKKKKKRLRIAGSYSQTLDFSVER